MIIGGSHTAAIRFARNNELIKNLNIEFSIPIYGANSFAGSLMMKNRIGISVLNPIIDTEIKKHKKSAAGRTLWLVSNFFGNHANRISLINTPHSFDFYHPELIGDSFEEKIPLIPYLLVKDVLYEQLQPLEDFFLELKKKGLKNIIHIEGPPPIENQDHINSSLLGEQKKLALSKVQTDEKEEFIFEINPFKIRKKLWLLQSEVTKEICEKNDIIYLPPPSSTFNENGGLKEEAWRDSVHANAWYGLRVLQQIDQEILRRNNS
jgi:hypothetical protein